MAMFQKMGDLLDNVFDACKPGDIRGSFEVADQKELTILAGVADGRGTLKNWLSTRGFPIGYAAEGNCQV